MEDLKYPIGKCQIEKEITEEMRLPWIQQIAQLPGQLQAAVKGFTKEQLATPYRPEGWTVLQVVHHLADSHMHAYIRFRFGLTEDHPTIKPYHEGSWADLADARTSSPDLSLAILQGIHTRWALLAQSLSPADFSRKIVHPERGELSLDTLLNLYSWHGCHHLAHIQNLKARQGW
jgi:hypothetical protein